MARAPGRNVPCCLDVDGHGPTRSTPFGGRWVADGWQAAARVGWQTGGKSLDSARSRYFRSVRLPSLPPADQPRYRDTAWADTRAVLGHRAVVILVAVVALAGTEASAFLSANELSVAEKIVLAALGAGGPTP
jgi:hypothetical protein